MSTAKILLGITGSVGVLNMPSYLPLLSARYPKMRVILTKSTAYFVSKEAISLLANEVCTDLFPTPFEREQSHVGLADWADLFVVLPATAHVLAQAAHGFADTLLSATIVSHSKPIIFVPNMNPAMWHNPATQRNVRLLREYGHKIAAPVLRQTLEVLLANEIKEAPAMPSVEAVIQLIEEELRNRSKKMNMETKNVPTSP